jgi:hypothetical protein
MIPDNMIVVWHRGDFSTCEVISQPIVNGFAKGTLKTLKYERNETEQLPEERYKALFLFCLDRALQNPQIKYEYLRRDMASVVPENENNKPYDFRDGHDSAKYFNVYGHRWMQEMGGEKIEI